MEQKIAIVSDIHGNSFALKEVLKDIAHRNVDVILNLGDSLYGPLDPVGTFGLLNSHKVISVMGNQDRVILENLEKESGIMTLEYVKSQLGSEIVDWLGNLPFEKVVNDTIYCCHASPQSDCDYLLEKLLPGGAELKGLDEIDQLLGEVKQSVVVCGHSHVSNIVKTRNKLVINPGSVGLPAYDDTLPVFHKMQNFNPWANYAILSAAEGSFMVDRVSVDYDHEASARLAEKNKREDWAKWIRTGMA
jgi:predicted phosphodiesterase